MTTWTNWGNQCNKARWCLDLFVKTFSLTSKQIMTLHYHQKLNTFQHLFGMRWIKSNITPRMLKGQSLIQAKLTRKRQQQQRNMTWEHVFVLLKSVFLTMWENVSISVQIVYEFANLVGTHQEKSGVDLAILNARIWTIIIHKLVEYLRVFWVRLMMRPIQVQESHSIN